MNIYIRCIVLFFLTSYAAFVMAQTKSPPPVIISGDTSEPIIKAGGDTAEGRKQEENRKKAQALWDEGEEFAKQKNWNSAIRVLEEALKLYDGVGFFFHSPRVMLAEAYENTGQLDKAIAVYRLFIRAQDGVVAEKEKRKVPDSNIVEPYIRFAQLLYKRGLYDQAREAYDVAMRFFQSRPDIEVLVIRLDGRNSASVYTPKRLGAGINIMLVIAGNMVEEDSVPYFHAAAKALPNSGITQLLLARALALSENKPEEAKIALERAAQLGPLAIRKRAERALKNNDWDWIW